MKKFFTVVSAILWIYFIASVFDVNTHNMTDYNYSDWNLFILMERW